MRLKVCGMRDPENIRQLGEKVDPDFVGFIFYPGSVRYFPDGPEEIPAELPPEKRTGVFVNSSLTEIIGLARMFGLRNIQLHGSESTEFCRKLKETGFTVIKAFGISQKEDLMKTGGFTGSCDFFLFDTKTKKHGGSGRKFNWKMLDDVEISRPWFLSGGIDLLDVAAIKKLKSKPFAIDINSRFEIAPGRKDIQKILAFKNELLK